jgi:hypothetical protein
MNKKIALLTLLAISVHLCQAQKFILNAVWRDSVIAIDGEPGDWDQPFPYFDSKSKLQYSVVNDAKFIYVSVKTSDPKAQMKIMRAGMDVSFDATGKKKEVGTIRFPLPTDSKLDMTSDPGEIDQQVVERPDVKKMKLDWSASNKDLRTIGLKSIPANITQADSSKYGIQAAISWDRSDVMTYEVRVPFSVFYKEGIAAADTLKPITIGIKAYAMDLPLIPTNTNSDVTGTTTGGGNGMNNTGMNGGMPNTMNNNNRQQTGSPQPSMAIPKSVADMGLPLIVSIKIKLAYRSAQ